MFGYSRESWARLFREGTWVVLGQVSTAFAGLIGVRLLTELAPKSVFGEVSLLLGILAIGKNLFVAPVLNFQIRYHTEFLARGQDQEFTRRITRLCWRGTAGLLLVGIIAYFSRSLLFSQPVQPLLLGVLAAMICLDTIRSIESTRLQAEREQGRIAAWFAAEMWLIMLMTATGLWLLPTPVGYLAANGVATATAMFLFWPRKPRGTITPVADGTMETDADFTRRVLAFGLPFVPLALSSWMQNLGDRYILGSLKDYAEVGLYAAAYGIASRPMLAAGSVLTTVARPILFTYENTGQRGAARRVFLLWLAVAVAICMVAVAGIKLFGEQIALLLLAPSYRQGAPAIMTWVAIGYGLNIVIAAVESRILSHGFSRGLLVPGLVSVGVNLAMNWVLIPKLGALGAAQATAGAFAAQLLLSVWTLGIKRSEDVMESKREAPPPEPEAEAAIDDEVLSR